MLFVLYLYGLNSTYLIYFSNLFTHIYDPILCIIPLHILRNYLKLTKLYEIYFLYYYIYQYPTKKSIEFYSRLRSLI